VHGFSEINRRMLLVLRSQHQVSAFDMTPHANPLGFLAVWRRFVLCVLRSKPNALYLPLSGGVRQWVDMAFVLMARLRDVPVFVHHHSFSYLTDGQRSKVMHFSSMRNAMHIVLCEFMGAQLVQQYKIDPSKVRVLSNAAFLDEIEMPARVSVKTSPLRVGFLSNITAEKGIFEFFAVLSEAESHGLSLQGVIAGPVDAAVKDAFDTSLARSRNVSYVGPVYGADKAAYFSSIGVLFFPTRYPNEAEPVTILEALGHGVPVIAFARGCIAGMVPTAAGAVFPYSASFITQAIEALRPLAESPVVLAKASNAARLAFELQRASSSVTLASLVAEIGGMPVASRVSA
jgi:glycosyltransferase involved in cell wall biosynthesis